MLALGVVRLTKRLTEQTRCAKDVHSQLDVKFTTFSLETSITMNPEVKWRARKLKAVREREIQLCLRLGGLRAGNSRKIGIT